MGELQGHAKYEKTIHAFPELLEKCTPSSSPPPTILKYTYLEVLDENADSRDTMVDVISRLHHEFHIGESMKHLVVVGDAKTYQHLQGIKVEYGEKLSWLLPFPGDLHILMNYQPVLFKVFYDAGLKQIASASGYRGETLTSLQNCSNFSSTNYYILEAWEAIYIRIIESFLEYSDEAKAKLLELLAVFDPSLLPGVLEQCVKPLKELAKLFEDFQATKTGPNWKFWLQFLSSSLPYIALFCALRSGNWYLRLAGIKSMAPLFCAFDRPTYRKLVPQHIADCILLPPDILDHFEQGACSVSLTG